MFYCRVIYCSLITIYSSRDAYNGFAPSYPVHDILRGLSTEWLLISETDRSQGALDSVTEAQEDAFLRLFRIDADQVSRVLRFGCLEELAVFKDLVAYTSHITGHQLRANAFIRGLGFSRSEELSRSFVQLHA